MVTSKMRSLGFRRQQDSGRADVSLEEKERILTLEYFDGVIEQCENKYHENPNDTEIKSALDEAINNRKIYQKSQLSH